MAARQHEVIDVFRAIHEQALTAELSGDFETAHSGFNTVLEAVPEIRETIDEVQLSVLEADTYRDDSYTFLRQGLVLPPNDRSPEFVDAAVSGLERAARITAPYITGEYPLPDRRGRRELNAAYAKTLGCLARATVASQIFHGQLHEGSRVSDEQRQAQHWFGLAFMHARNGNSAYAVANIAITGARTEIANAAQGARARAAVWLARGISYGVLKMGRDIRVRDRIDAVLTLGSHARDLRNRKTALAAARDWRKV